LGNVKTVDPAAAGSIIPENNPALSFREATMPLADPASPIPAYLGQPRQTFQAPGDGSFLSSLLAKLSGKKNPFGLWTITVCDNGVASRDTRVVPNLNVLQNLDIRWDDFVTTQSSLTRTYRGFSSSDFNIYVYEAADGTTLGISSGVGMRGVDQLAAQIQDEIFKRQFPRLTSAFQAGETVQCGRLAIDQRGLTCDTEHIPWIAIARVSVDNGQFVVERPGIPALKMPVYEIKNFDIFWTILQSAMKGPGTG